MLDARTPCLPRIFRTNVSSECVSLSLRLKDLLGPVTRVKKKKKKECEWLCTSGQIHTPDVNALQKLD